MLEGAGPHTDGDGLNLDTLLTRSVVHVVGILVLENALSTESVDKGGSACRCK